MRRSLIFFVIFIPYLSTTPTWAGSPVPIEGQSTKEPDVPPMHDFQRSLELGGYVQRTDENGQGAQEFMLRTRYLDPDVNAFVGFVTELDRFNQTMVIGASNALDTSRLFWNWGINMGLKRGKSIWELDLMGSLLSSVVGPSMAIEGDHEISRHWGWYHRTEATFYFQDQDNVLDADQGAYWRNGRWSVSAGYRIFASKHMNRNGPRLGLHWTFDSPKIWFIFPSLG